MVLLCMNLDKNAKKSDCQIRLILCCHSAGKIRSDRERLRRARSAIGRIRFLDAPSSCSIPALYQFACALDVLDTLKMNIVGNALTYSNLSVQCRLGTKATDTNHPTDLSSQRIGVSNPT